MHLITEENYVGSVNISLDKDSGFQISGDEMWLIKIYN